MRDTNEFAPIENFPRKEYRLITTASADVPLKGLDYTLKALKILKNDFPKIHLIIIGKIKKNGQASLFLGYPEGIQAITGLSDRFPFTLWQG